MAIRQIGGEQGTPLATACNVVSTHQDEIAVGDLVEFSTSSNWAVNSTAAGTKMAVLGRVKWLSADSSIATVEWFGYNKVFENTYSAAAALGGVPVADTSQKTKGSGSDTSNLLFARIVHTDSTTGKCQWVSL